MKINYKKPKREVKEFFIHCSASDRKHHDNIEVIREWHVKENGWSDIGYHFFIDKAGNLFFGRDLEKKPAAQANHNEGTLAVCVSGHRKFTKDSMETLEELVKYTNEIYFGKIRFRGHREVANKECPVFNYKEILGLDEGGYLTKPTLEFIEPDKPKLSFWGRIKKFLGI